MKRAAAAFGTICVAVAAALLAAGAARADDADEAALRLADAAPEVTHEAAGGRLFVEGAAGRSGGDGFRRLSLDLRYEHALAPGLRAFVANRLDVRSPTPDGADAAINTLKEAYLGWQMSADALLDLGRINLKNGVAAGYNPTDWFRAGAVRSVVSIDPASLRENRQGSVMLRGQRLWSGGSLTVLYAPRLARSPDDDGLSLDFGATNGRERGLVAVGETFGGLALQFLVYREAERSTQYGLNLTALANDATVAHIEWSGGRERPSPLMTAAAGSGSADAWRNRLAAGFTWTSPQRLSLTAEYHYNGAGLGATAWNALRRTPPERLAHLRAEALATQEAPTRHTLFLHANWQDAFVPRLNLALMHHRDLTDDSRRLWFEARYHAGDIEYAIQWQRGDGSPTSRFGAFGGSPSWQAVLRHYFQ